MKKKPPRLIMTKGLPASGKSTWAKEFQSRHHDILDRNVIRINKDLLRSMLHSGVWSKEKEKVIIEARDLLVHQFLAAGNIVIVDDTNLVPIHEETLRKIAEVHSADFFIEDFTHVPIETCIARDFARQDSVGEHVIRKMHRQFLSGDVRVYNPLMHHIELPNCIIVDIDGTIAHNNGHRKWMEFDKVYGDDVKWDIVSIIDCMLRGYETTRGDIQVFFFSGREGTDTCTSETLRWLSDKIFKSAGGALMSRESFLYMRKEKDYRADEVIKKEMYHEHIEGQYNVLAVFDDRNKVVKMWRELGLPVLQVAEGDF